MGDQEWTDVAPDELDNTTKSDTSTESKADGLILQVEYHLLDAAGRGNLEKAQQAVASGAPVNCSDAYKRTPLMIACCEGHKDLVVYLLQLGADINLRDKKNSYALRDAVMSGHYAIRDLLLQKGAQVDEADTLELGKVLCTKAAAGDLEGVRELLRCRAAVNAVMYDKRTALHLSAAEGHDSVVSFLLQNGAEAGFQDRWGGSALLDATRGNHLACVALLRDAGVSDAFADASGGALHHLGTASDIAERPKSSGSSGSGHMVMTDDEKMCKAAAKGDMKCLGILVARGADVNAMDYDKRSALHLAAAEGHLEVVRFLVQKGSNVNSPDRWGSHPLRDAVQGNHTEVVEVLTRAGGTNGLKDTSEKEFGDKMCKAASRGDLQSLRSLVAKGATVDCCDYDKRSALHLAAAEGHAAVVEFLVENGVAINVQDRWGGTALKDAQRGGHKAVQDLLTKAGATYGYDDTSQGVHGEQLCKAAAKGDLNQIRKLVEQGVNLAAHDYDKRSALHLSAAEGHVDVVDYLIRHKADVLAKDRFGADALRDAIRGKHNAVQQVLFNAGACKTTMEEQEQKAMSDEYQSQPLHVRAKAERWIIARSEIHIGTLLGEGQQGQVLKADWRGMVVVVKIIKNARASTDELDFQNEISIMSTLRHPNLVLFLGAVLENEPKMLVSEFLDGGSLEDFFECKFKDKMKPFLPPVAMVHRWAVELGMAIAFLHGCRPPVIHRDIKPGNLLLTAEGHLKVSDFGLSKIFEGAQLGAYQMTGVTGTLRYMAPEVMRSEDYTEKVDVYSFSFVIWYMLHGERPLLGTVEKDFVSAAENHIALRPSLGDVTFLPFKALMEKCWEPDALGRLTAADAVLQLKAMTLPKSTKERGAKANKFRNQAQQQRDGKKCSIS
eukprot:CAMPEP_0179421922 /NCGR_PEP_ID=MMETSP0799-20121207/10102_1 /TAXON_ID=46947 /ORGANISM="Geminigera cryophila, Strain CCMP2564" /LENGTH=893 /DNA_ID=CAMNT_0021195917 /DNA_START=41 /DNA_END=2722 /DNA_ORIENTATION=+